MDGIHLAPVANLSNLIPVQSGTHVIEHLPLEILQQSPSKYRIKFNKRGNATRAFVRERDIPWASITSRGTSFLQRLPEAGSVVWALQGVRGS
jgi:hypothetical protein